MVGSFIFFLSGVCVYYRRHWLHIFCQLLNRLAYSFSTWSGLLKVLPIYSGQYSSPSCSACTHHDSVIGAPNIALTNNKPSVQNVFGYYNFFHCRTYPSLRWLSIVNIIGGPYLNITTVFGVLLVQDIPSSFLNERTRRHLICALKQHMLSRIRFHIKVY